VTTSSATEPQIVLKAQLVVQPAVAVRPSQITLGQGPLANSIGPAVSIRNNGSERLELSSASINAPGAEVHVQETQPDNSFRVTVQFPAGFELKPDDEVAVTVNTNHPKYPVIRVPVVLSKRPAARAKAVEVSEPSSDEQTDEVHDSEVQPEQ
jgi:hypothetical protein